MSKKATKRAAKKKIGGLADLAPQAGRGQDVKGGAFDSFAKFGDIKGESTDKDHKDWVVITKY